MNVSFFCEPQILISMWFDAQSVLSHDIGQTHINFYLAYIMDGIDSGRQ